ncbi:hypothetical protein IAT40_003972 [Kwoniella sp. CBS 6097]
MVEHGIGSRLQQPVAQSTMNNKRNLVRQPTDSRTSEDVSVFSFSESIRSRSGSRWWCCCFPRSSSAVGSTSENSRRRGGGGGQESRPQIKEASASAGNFGMQPMRTQHPMVTSTGTKTHQIMPPGSASSPTNTSTSNPPPQAMRYASGPGGGAYRAEGYEQTDLRPPLDKR